MHLDKIFILARKISRIFFFHAVLSDGSYWLPVSATKFTIIFNGRIWSTILVLYRGLRHSFKSKLRKWRKPLFIFFYYAIHRTHCVSSLYKPLKNFFFACLQPCKTRKMWERLMRGIKEYCDSRGKGHYLRCRQSPRSFV